MGKEKVQFTLTFYLKQNKEVQFDIQRFEIFLFSSLLQNLPPGQMLEEKVNVPIFVIWNMRYATERLRLHIAMDIAYEV